MTDAEWWNAVMDKSKLEAEEWIKKNSEHLDKLNEWLDTEVRVGNTSYNQYYDGYIRELIYVLGMQHHVICQCIEKKKKENRLMSRILLRNEVLRLVKLLHKIYQIYALQFTN